MSCPFGVLEIGAKPDDEMSVVRFHDRRRYNKKIHSVLFATWKIPISETGAQIMKCRPLVAPEDVQ